MCIISTCSCQQDTLSGKYESLTLNNITCDIIKLQSA